MRSCPKYVLLLLSLVTICSAQHHNHSVSMLSSGKYSLEGAIDGSVTPDQIPDSTAYRVFFRALTADTDTARKAAMLTRANLSPSDLIGVSNAASLFETLRSDFQAKMQTAASNRDKTGTPIDIAGLIAAQASIGTQVKGLLALQLSKSGMIAIDSVIQSEKRNMTVFPLPDMSGAQ